MGHDLVAIAERIIIHDPLNGFPEALRIERRVEVVAQVEGAVKRDLNLGDTDPGINLGDMGEDLFKGLVHQVDIPEVAFVLDRGGVALQQVRALHFGIVHGDHQELPICGPRAPLVLDLPLLVELPEGNKPRNDGQKDARQAGEGCNPVVFPRQLPCARRRGVSVGHTRAPKLVQCGAESQVGRMRRRCPGRTCRLICRGQGAQRPEMTSSNTPNTRTPHNGVSPSGHPRHVQAWAWRKKRAPEGP